MEKNEEIIVGVNKYEDPIKAESMKLQKIDKKSIKDQLNRLKIFKSTRNKKAVNLALHQLKDSLNDKINLLPIIINCIKSKCTLGEICQVMRDIHGEHV